MHTYRNANVKVRTHGFGDLVRLAILLQEIQIDAALSNACFSIHHLGLCVYVVCARGVCVSIVVQLPACLVVSCQFDIPDAC
jgi:hypothetical protein